MERKKIGQFHYFDPHKSVEYPVDRSFNMFVRLFFRLTGTKPAILADCGYPEIAKRASLGGFMLMAVVLAWLAAALFIESAVSFDSKATASDPHENIVNDGRVESSQNAIIKSAQEILGVIPFHEFFSKKPTDGDKKKSEGGSIWSNNVFIVSVGATAYALFIYLFDLTIILSNNVSKFIIFMRGLFSIFVAMSVSTPISISLFKSHIISIMEEQSEIPKIQRRIDEINRKSRESIDSDGKEFVKNQTKGEPPVEDRSSNHSKDNSSLSKANDNQKNEGGGLEDSADQGGGRSSQLENIITNLQASKSILETADTCLSRAIEGEINGKIISNCRDEVYTSKMAMGLYSKPEEARAAVYDQYNNVFSGLKADNKARINFSNGSTTGVRSKANASNRAEYFLTIEKSKIVSNLKTIDEKIADSKNQKAASDEKEKETLKAVSETTKANLRREELINQSNEKEILSKNLEIKRIRHMIDSDALGHHKALISDVLFSGKIESIVAWPIMIMLFIFDVCVLMAKQLWIKTPVYDGLIDQHLERVRDKANGNPDKYMPRAIEEKEYQKAVPDIVEEFVENAVVILFRSVKAVLVKSAEATKKSTSYIWGKTVGRFVK